ncbi:MAG TPA: ABC transporter permease [Candidatus Limnocylindria bacterium]|nr:ABC transporter permease [Candidatus Limnocylindria bacterium]
MNLSNAIAVGLKEIWAHKFRSLLTMLGIILGVSSLIGMSAITKGMENGMKEALIAMGGLDKVVTDEQDVPAHQNYRADEAPGRTIQDVYALKHSAPLLKSISPEMRGRNMAMTRGGKTSIPSELLGVWPVVLEMNLHKVGTGRFFTDLDDAEARAVCVIGTGIRDELFGDPQVTGREINPVDEIVNINGQPFTIIGMFEHYEAEADRKIRELKAAGEWQEKTQTVTRARGWGGGKGGRGGWIYHQKNMTAYIPLNTMWVRFRSAAGSNNVPDARLSDIDLKVQSLDKLEPALQQARNVMILKHRGIEDFSFRTQENNVENINTAIRNARMSGGIIAAISLLVGGIGIMNIMLASITERVREIGLRKAVGATTAAVFIQILVESVVIGIVGGIAGLIVSYGFVKLLADLTPTGNSPVITIEAMMMAFTFSAVVGLVAGLIPAFKASKLDPIQALRYE